MISSDHHVLLVDDDSDALLSLVRALKSTGIEAKIHAAGNALKALEIQREIAPQVAVVDLCLDERKGVESGLTLISDLLKNDSSCRIIVLTGHGSAEHGVASLKRGAGSFIEKPAQVPHLAALIHDGIKQSLLRRIVESGSAKHLDAEEWLVGTSELMKEVQAEVKFAAFSAQSVFISGETGTGKSLCARSIHALSPRRHKQFVRYQPTFASADLINSDLFGHRKGAFTGAADDRKGLLQECHEGTLFLDELDELPLETQILLLGLLQDRSYRPVGGNQEIKADFRLITASNADMDLLLNSGKVRKDFYHRVAHCAIELPPLRKRLEDIPLLAVRILEIIRNRDGIAVYGMEDAAHQKLNQYEWPGNIRELEAVVEGAAYRAQYQSRREIEVNDISLKGSLQAGQESRGNVGVGYHEQLSNFKLKLIEDALKRHNGNQVHAARELGLDRSTLRRLIAAADSA